MRLLIVDDHQLFRSGLAAMMRHRLGAHATIVEAASYTEALAILAEASAFDAVLCDIDMPDLGPQRHIGRIVALAGSTPVIVVTASTFPSVDASARALGARGYINKSQSLDDVLTAIDAVVRGETSFPPAIGDAPAQRKAVSNRGAKAGLTPRETQVLMALAQGQSNKEIARTQGVSDNAIKIHVRNIFSKLGVNNRTQAAMRAAEIFFGSTSGDAPTPPPSDRFG
jgi:DNA-binding NarL/FixJ family response regulator